MPDLTPETREENLWVNEGDLTPITRREQYIKHLYDETQVIPDHPVTREEWFINKAGEELHDVTIEQLTATENRTYSEEGVAYSPVIVNVPQTTLTTLDVTENGTYTAPSGTAYNEVEVDVPLPDNAYLLKEIEDVEIATFTDGSPLPMPKLEVAVEPQQDLHGYDSPWVGGSGRNLFSVGSRVDRNIADVRYTSDDEYIYLNGTKQGIGYADLSSSSNITLDSGTYYIRAFVISGTASNTIELYPYDGTNNLTGNIINNERTLTLSESKTFRFRFTIWTDGTVLTNYKVGIVVSKTSSIDKFYPYSNICPISGWDEANIVVSPTTDAEDGTTYTIQFKDGDNPLTVYGGSLDVVSGVLTVDRAYLTIDDFNSSGGSGTSAGGLHWFDVKNKPEGKTGNKNICSVCSYMQNGWTSTTTVMSVGISNTIPVRIYDSSESLSDFKDKYPNLQLVYELATPTTIQLTPTQVNSLLGVNNIWADCGDIIDGQYFSKGE